MDAVGVAELEKSLSEGAIRTVACAIPDIWGRLVGKRLTTNGFLEALSGAGGVHASSYLFASDMEMEPRPGFKLTNWDDGFSDFIMRPDLTTFRILPWQDGTALVLCDAVEEHTGDFLQMAPRTILKKQLDRAKGLGLTLKCATELEFFLFRTDYDEAWKKRYRDLAPTSRYRADYHLLQSTRDEDFIGLVRDRLADAGIAVENAKTEWGLGQQEITLNYCDALMMADRHALYKHWVKEAASEFGYSATFMAKPFIEEVGSSCHIHASFWDANTGQPISHETGEPAGMSRRFASFVAGMIQGGREYSYLSAPSINSYKRFQDELFAPCQMVLGLDNRTCGFRLVGEGASFRVESRLPGADANPYLALAGLVSSGLDGFEANLAAPETYQGNAYENHSLPRVPSTMREAVSLFSNGEKVRSALGADVHEHLVNFAAQELRSFEQETVTDWEMMRYFERI